MDAQSKIKILLIEDDLFMIELLAGELQKAGFEVHVARTIKDGVAAFTQFQPALILLDLLLPDGGGFDALREIRQLPNGPHTKVIVISNLSETRETEEAKRLGAVDYLVKANTVLPEIIQHIQVALGL